MNTPNLRPSALANQRRSQRILLAVPLRVSGKRVNGAAFVEHVNTLIVNAHGALIPLSAAVREGQPLNLRNMTTGEEVHCTVVDLNPGANGVPEVGVEFVEPNPRFWRVSFPPVDWSTRSPEAKRFSSSPTPAQVPPKLPTAKR